MHPLIKYIYHWNEYNAEARKMNNLYWLNTFIGILSFAVLMVYLLG